MNKQTGFSLIELMVTVVIIGIITSVAVPSYQRYVVEASRIEGMTALLDIMRLQEDYFANNLTYTDNLVNLNYTGPVETDSGRYLITADECTGLELTDCIELTATAQFAQSEDGNLVLDSRGIRSRDGVAGWID